MSKYTPFKKPKNIKIKNNSIDFSTTNIMGILNITNDSFYDGGRYITEEKIIQQCGKMLKEGAKIIDLGACSSRPGSIPISVEEEIEKLLPIISKIKKEFPKIIISIDTFRSIVAEKCILQGADIINDISSGQFDNKMFDVIAKYNIPYIIMHMQGKPENMQSNPKYNNVTKEVFMFFKQKIELLKNKGIDNIIIDPGFGFGKTIRNNYELLNNLHVFNKLKKPILVGVSRKSMIYNILNSNAKNALNGTSVIHTLALLKKINILRVHDVKEAMECIKIIKFAESIK